MSGNGDGNKMRIKNLTMFYGDFMALEDISLDFASRRITALIGPSGCGKSTLVRCLNRMNDLIEGSRVEGEIILDGENILERDTTSSPCGAGWAWSSRGPIPSPRVSTTTWPMAPAWSG